MAFLHDEQLITTEITPMTSLAIFQAVQYTSRRTIRVISVVISCSSCRNAIYRSARNIETVPETSSFFLYCRGTFMFSRCEKNQFCSVGLVELAEDERQEALWAIHNNIRQQNREKEIDCIGAIVITD